MSTDTLESTPGQAPPEVPLSVVHSAQGGDTSDFQPVCAYNGYDFGYAKATEGTSFRAHTFPGNFANLKGRPRGAYHFYHPALNAGDQARFFWSVVKAQNPEPGDFLVGDIEIMVGADGSWVIDPSAEGRMNAPEMTMSAAPPAHAGALTNGARLFLDELSSLAGPHHPVLVYTNLNVGSQLTSCTGYGLIIAHDPPGPPPTGPWKTWRMWQWGAGGGPCGGDSDAFNGTKADLLAWQDSFKPGPPPPPPPPTHTYQEDSVDLTTETDARTVIGIPAGTKSLIFVSNGGAEYKCQFTGGDPSKNLSFPDVKFGYNSNQVLPVPAGATGAIIHFVSITAGAHASVVTSG